MIQVYRANQIAIGQADVLAMKSDDAQHETIV